MKTPFPWYGGKARSAKKIIQHFPGHQAYLEPFGGAASVLLSKPPARTETYNDLNHRVARFFRVLQEQREELVERLRLVLYSEEEFESALRYQRENDRKHPGSRRRDLNRAIRDFIIWRQSFAGEGSHWGYKVKCLNQGVHACSAWLGAIEGLAEVAERFKRVQIACRPAIKAIEKFDTSEGLIYCDPPYLESTCKGKGHYGKLTMSKAEHRGLAEVLNACESRVVISGYANSLYDSLYPGWGQVELGGTFVTASRATSGRRKTRECLWMNF